MPAQNKGQIRAKKGHTRGRCLLNCHPDGRLAADVVDDGDADAAVPLHHLHVHLHDLGLGLDRHLHAQKAGFPGCARQNRLIYYLEA